MAMLSIKSTLWDSHPESQVTLSPLAFAGGFLFFEILSKKGLFILMPNINI